MTIQPGSIIPEFTLADRLRKARELTGLDQGPFGDELGISRATVSNSERGLSKPQRIVIRQWAMRTGVPLEWLETGQAPGGNPTPDQKYTPRDSNPEPIVLGYSRSHLRILDGDAA